MADMNVRKVGKDLVGDFDTNIGENFRGGITASSRGGVQDVRAAYQGQNFNVSGGYSPDSGMARMNVGGGLPVGAGYLSGDVAMSKAPGDNVQMDMARASYSQGNTSVGASYRPDDNAMMIDLTLDF